MIRVMLLDDCYVHIVGHANAAPKGQDIVCAGVSAMVGTLLENLHAERIEPLDARIVPGDVEIRCKSTRKARRLFRYFRCGILRLAKDYSEFIMIV